MFTASVVALALAVFGSQSEIGRKALTSVVATGSAATVPFTTLLISASGTTTLPQLATGTDGEGPELDQGMADSGDDQDKDTNAGGFPMVNRTIAAGPGPGAPAQGSARAKSNPELMTSFQGLNFHDQRFANGGNQFSVEPPDQGLCAGAGYVLESANDVLRVFDASGNALTGVVDLNTFYGYAPAINRAVSPLTFGPSVTDPSCYFDADTQHWFHVVLTLDRANSFTQSLSGANHLDIAVSATSNPMGSWTLYRIPVQNDGTQGTPDHHCLIRVNPTTFAHGPCLGDYPHIGADANGFYVTTNEFDLASPGRFHAAQIYALSKHQLAAGAATVNAVLFDTADPGLALPPSSGDPASGGVPGFTVWPAQSPAADYAPDTEFFMSSTAVFFGFDTRVAVWTMTNTSSLDSGSPAPNVTLRTANVTGYGIPPSSAQKAGNTPLRDCIADPACAPIVGSAVFNDSLARLPSNDSRMQQVFYANGKLWGALDTGLVFTDDPATLVAGIAYFVLNPSSLHVFAQGYVGVENNNATYPALAVTPSGRGVIAFTLVGPDHYPSAAYVSVDAKIGAGDVHVAEEGAGPQDGFSGYRGLANPVRPRWGDYGAAATDGNTIWIASEYIGQTCTYADFRTSSPFGVCGGTRGSLGNWSTRVSQVSVQP
ncbi:MAG TPA: hypothetical protein VEU08_02500 [Vicinamibacterales bacterium]|nr:hypothetical protein [Vicinamibacterales bacterium]